VAIQGNNQTPNTAYFFDDFGNSEFWADCGNLPAGGGIVTDLYVYVAGDGASVTGQYVIWGASAILWQSGNLTIPAGSRSIGGQSWQHVAVPNVFIAGGTPINIGWWTSGNVVWTVENSGGGTWYLHSQSSPGPISGSNTEGGGNPGAYLVYTPGGIMRVRRSGTWTIGQVQVRRAGVWTTPQGVYVRRSGVWVNVS
jgi:hypothetical protein